MSKETKIGLLVGLGIILVFALILNMHLSGKPHAPLGTTVGGGAQTATIAQDDRPDPISSSISELAATDGAHGVSDSGAQLANSDLVPSREETGSLVAGPISDSTRGAGDVQPPAGPLSSDIVPGPTPGRGVLPPPAAPTATIYLVQQGDTFPKIAEKVFGSKSKAGLIAKANPTVVPTRMKIGTKLTIPAIEAPRTAAGTFGGGAVGPVAPSGPSTGLGTETNVSFSSGGPRSHVVAAGETIGTISQKYYGTCKKANLIIKANKNVNANRMKVGTKLVIPAEASVPTRTTPISASDTTLLAAADAPAVVMPVVEAAPPAIVPDVPAVGAIDTAPETVSGSVPMPIDPALAAAPATPATPATSEIPATPATPATPAALVAGGSTPVAPAAIAVGDSYEAALAGAREFVTSQQPTATYKVRSGDTLSVIAKRLLGSSNKWKQIYDLNRDTLATPQSKLKLGQQLKVPAPAAVALAMGGSAIR